MKGQIGGREMPICWPLLLSLIMMKSYNGLCVEKTVHTSRGDLTTHSDRPSTKTPRFLSSLIVKFCRSGFSKSDITCTSNTPFIHLINMVQERVNMTSPYGWSAGRSATCRGSATLGL